MSTQLAKPGPHELILVLDKLGVSFNAGKIYRSAETFGIHEIHLIDMPYFDPAPAKGCIKKVKSRNYESFKESYDYLLSEGYELFVFDPTAETFMHNSEFPKKSAFIMGNEDHGFSFDLGEFPALNPIKIQQFGQTESLNVSVVASLSIYEYLGKNNYLS